MYYTVHTLWMSMLILENFVFKGEGLQGSKKETEEPSPCNHRFSIFVNSSTVSPSLVILIIPTLGA